MSEDNKQKKLTVKEIQEIAPLSEVYELNKYAPYLVRITKSALVVDPNHYKQKASVIAKMFDALKIPCVIMIHSGDVEFFELKEIRVDNTKLP